MTMYLLLKMGEVLASHVVYIPIAQVSAVHPGVSLSETSGADMGPVEISHKKKGGEQCVGYEFDHLFWCIPSLSMYIQY